MTGRRLALYFLYFLSGASGLVYEVSWVRQFGNYLGNTIHSASLVSSVFMLSLGLGSYGAGAWADRRRGAPPRTLLAAYGAAELLIGAFAALLALLLPRLAGVSALLSSYALDGRGYFTLSFGSLAARYAVAALLMTPPTLLMGGTLTLLIRFLLAGELDLSGWRIGALYGFNTLGAAVGCIATDFALVPTLGVRGAQLAAAAASASVGLAALALARAEPLSATRARASSPPAVEDAPSTTPPRVKLTAATLFLTGLSSLGLEIVWFRVLAGTLGAYRQVFSLLLAVILAGIWLGAVLGGAAHRRFKRPVEMFVVAQGLLVLATLGLLASFDRARVVNVPLVPARGFALLVASVRQYSRELVPILSVVGLPALMMGFSFPLASATVQEAEEAIGRRAGLLYFANTAGSVVGSLLAGFVLLPWIGSQRAAVVFAVAAGLSCVPIAIAQPASSRAGLQRPLAMAACLAVPAIAGWLFLPPTYVLDRFLEPPARGQRTLETSEGVDDIVVIRESAGMRSLFTNGHPMSATSLNAQRYMRAFVHVPLLGMPHPESVLVICFGVGNTLDAVSMYPSVERIDLADISSNVLAHAGYFAATNHGVLRDPRVRVFVNDGRQHLRMTAETYDLVTLEPPPIAFAGVSSLYSREFYSLVRERLKPGGAVTQWLPAYQVPLETTLSMVRTFVDVFPDAVLLSGERAELILYGSKSGPPRLDLDRVEEGLRNNPRVAADLKRVLVPTLVELAGMFVADGAALQEATAGAPPVTDDDPRMEYADYSLGLTRAIPRALFHVDRIGAYCPSCFEGGRPAARVAGLDRYMAALGMLYRSRDFLHNRYPAHLDHPDEIADAVAASPYLEAILGPSLARPAAK